LNKKIQKKLKNLNKGWLLGRDNLAILRLINTFNVYGANIKVSKRLKAYVNHHYETSTITTFTECPEIDPIKSAYDSPIIYAPYFPTVRRIYPELIAHDIVGVQPMDDGPVGFAAALRHQYGEGANTDGFTYTHTPCTAIGYNEIVTS